MSCGPGLRSSIRAESICVFCQSARTNTNIRGFAARSLVFCARNADLPFDHASYSTSRNPLSWTHGVRMSSWMISVDFLKILREARTSVPLSAPRMSAVLAGWSHHERLCAQALRRRWRRLDRPQTKHRNGFPPVHPAHRLARGQASPMQDHCTSPPRAATASPETVPRSPPTVRNSRNIRGTRRQAAFLLRVERAGHPQAPCQQARASRALVRRDVQRRSHHSRGETVAGQAQQDGE